MISLTWRRRASSAFSAYSENKYMSTMALSQIPFVQKWQSTKRPHTDYELLHQNPRLPLLGSQLYRCQATTNYYLAQKFSQSTKHPMTFSMLKKFYLTTKTEWDSFYWQKPATDAFGEEHNSDFSQDLLKLTIIELDGNSLWGTTRRQYGDTQNLHLYSGPDRWPKQITQFSSLFAHF